MSAVAPGAARTELAEVFERTYFPPTGTPWPPLRWRGIPCQKLASDLWAIGQLVWELHPALIVETGTAAGGTAAFLADLLALAGGPGWVLTIDVACPAMQHPRVTFVYGSSLDPRPIGLAQAAAQQADGPVLVILDSDHHAQHVAGELDAYAPLVTVGSYLIVEDTNLGRSVMREHGPGPAMALEHYLADHAGEWWVDTQREPAITTNPGGLVRRVGAVCPQP